MNVESVTRLFAVGGTSPTNARLAFVATHQVETGTHGFDERQHVVVQALLHQVSAVAAAHCE